jgi:hypothetical protein
VINAGVLRYDALGRVLTTTANPGPHFNGGTPILNGYLCITPGPPIYYNGGFGYGIRGRVGETQAILPAFDAPFQNDQGEILGTTDPPAYYYAGLPLSAAGRLCLAPAVAAILAEMSVGHILTVGINPGGNRVGYRRGEWGDFQPDDVPSLSRLFTNLSNNRLVVQADGDLSAMVLTNIHIHRISNGMDFDFGAPNSVLFDGVFTDFTWLVPFDFVLGEQYEVSLS